MSLREKLTDEVLMDAYKARDEHYSWEAMRTVLLAALEYGSQIPADCGCCQDTADYKEHATDCAYYLRMAAAAPRRESE